MHEDEIDEELRKFEEASKKGGLKVPLDFPAPEDSVDEYSGSEIEVEPEYEKKNKERAIEISRKKKNKNPFNLDGRE